MFGFKTLKDFLNAGFNDLMVIYTIKNINRTAATVQSNYGFIIPPVHLLP